MANITILVDIGCFLKSVIELHEKVPIATIIITATKAAIGICFNHGPRNTTIINKNTPADSVDNRPRPPDFILIIDCPIIAQPAIPPRKPVNILATPWPLHSRFLSLLVSVRSSTIVAVIMDSNNPTTAKPIEYGKIINSVSKFKGTSGHKKIGKVSGRCPISPTVRTSILNDIEIAVNTIIQTKGEGTNLPITGRYGNR